VHQRSAAVRVLFGLRVDAFRRIGGDTVQASKTRDALRSLGVHVDLTTDLNSPLRGYDLVHVFNLVRVHETFWFARHAVREGVPVVLSPIYWDFDEVERRWQGALLSLALRVLGRDVTERLKTAARIVLRGERNVAALVQLVYGYRRQQQQVVAWSSCLLPNSTAEQQVLGRRFNLRNKLIAVVPNAVDPLFAEGDGSRFKQRYGLENFVLCVGRFEPLKNQLRLVQAMGDLEMPLVLIGSPNPNHRKYFRRLVQKASMTRAPTLVLGPMTARELADAYAAAKVHVQPSWVETTGLASLEAGLAGCNLVVARLPPVREYFGDYVWYCDPGDVSSIRRAILEAWASPPRPELGEHIRKNYTWERAAQVTLKAYRQVLEAHTDEG
jgi:glycosyltransferase involved in cell wall biosynthesis